MTVARRAWEKPLAAHAAALVLLLVVLAPVVQPATAWTSDEGAYGLQVEALRHGSWEYDYRAADLDPQGAWFPIANATERGDHRYPYVKHPAWPVALWSTGTVAGNPGLLVLPLAAVVLAATGAWLLAREVDPGLARAAFWLTAASPVLFNGYLLWAHAPAAAAGALAGLAGVRLGRGARSGAMVALLAAALSVGVLLRSEGVLFGAAVAAALLVARRSRPRAAIGLAAVALAATAATAVAELAWIDHLAGGAAPDLGASQVDGDLPYLAARLAGGFHLLVDGGFGSTGTGVLVGTALALVAFGVGAHRWGGADRSRRLLLALFGAIAIYGVRLAVAPSETMTGLLAAWPVMVIGLGALPWRRLDPARAFLAVTIGLFTAAVLLTQYVDGGALQWGGRFLSPIVPLLAVLVADGLREVLARVEVRPRRWLAAGLAGLVLVPATAGVVVLARGRADLARDFDVIAAPPSDVFVSTDPYLPRWMWGHDDMTWLHAGPGELGTVLRRLRQEGVDDVTVVAPAGLADGRFAPYRQVTDVGGRQFAGSDTDVVRLRP